MVFIATNFLKVFQLFVNSDNGFLDLTRNVFVP